MTTYEKDCSEPWFSIIKLGLKKVEGRLLKNDFAKMKKGDKIIFWNEEFGFRREFKVRITSLKRYDSFYDYFKGEKLEKALPGIDTVEEGIKVYRKYFSEEKEKKYGVVAIRLLKIS